MLHKEDCIVPFPGMRREKRVKENLSAADVELTEAEYQQIETTLKQIDIYGSRTDEDIAKLHHIEQVNNSNITGKERRRV